MLSPIETYFVRLLRGTVIATAFISFAVTILALLYAAYAQFSPDPTPRIASKVERIRNELAPTKLLQEVFPAGTDLKKEVESSSTQRIPYTSKKRFDDEIFSEFNKFLDGAFGASFENLDLFRNWIYGTGRIPFAWSRSIDSKEASSDDNIDVLWRSLLFDYAQRLQPVAPFIASARKSKASEQSIDRLTSPTLPSRAPYFLVWYFNQLREELDKIATEYNNERVQREALRLTAPLALSIAAGAFSYFIFIMFLFLLISIEASIRLFTSSRLSPTAPPPDTTSNTAIGL